jgi:hypothetical protein
MMFDRVQQQRSSTSPSAPNAPASPQ